ncbi:hypothetical protein B0H14DRAFT_3566586 [Mycena olivaceomarginata]|nr:hypothetical protein B0H14DRAFT_3566586 [Mycena olivaceomarginata]
MEASLADPLPDHLDTILGYSNDLKRGNDAIADYKPIQLTLQSLPEDFTGIVQTLSVVGAMMTFSTATPILLQEEQPQRNLLEKQQREEHALKAQMEHLALARAHDEEDLETLSSILPPITAYHILFPPISNDLDKSYKLQNHLMAQGFIVDVPNEERQSLGVARIRIIRNLWVARSATPLITITTTATCSTHRDIASHTASLKIKMIPPFRPPSVSSHLSHPPTISRWAAGAGAVEDEAPTTAVATTEVATMEEATMAVFTIAVAGRGYRGYGGPSHVHPPMPEAPFKAGLHGRVPPVTAPPAYAQYVQALPASPSCNPITSGHVTSTSRFSETMLTLGAGGEEGWDKIPLLWGSNVCLANTVLLGDVWFSDDKDFAGACLALHLGGGV